MPENPLEVDSFIAERRDMQYLDTDGDGSVDGFRKLLLWVLYDLPYPTAPHELDTFDPLSNREFEALDKLAIIGERSEVIIHRIRGHASAEGDPADNEKLSLRRAEAVAERIQAISSLNNVNVRISATAIIEGRGEFEPAVYAGDDDHPLNRRVEIEFEIGQIIPAPTPADPDDLPGTNWRIGYDQNFSFYMQLGAQIGFGTLERLDANGDSFTPPHKKEFWYFAGGWGYEFKGKLASKVASARNKLNDNQQLTSADKLALFIQKQMDRLTQRIDKMIPERASRGYKDLWKQTTEYFEEVGPAQWANTHPNQKAVAILEAMGLNGIVSSNLLDGTFTTDKPWRMSEMDVSVQLLFQATVGAQVGVGGSFTLTSLLMYIFDADHGESGEWISTAISSTALDQGLIPSFGASVSANISTLQFR